jgi:hypothetical protein
VAGDLPLLASIARAPDAAARDADEQLLRVLRVRADRVDARKLRSPTKPVLALRVVPEAAHQLPRAAAIVRSEEATADRAAPERVIHGLERPDLLDTPGPWLAIGERVHDIVRLLREGRCGQLLPALATIRGGVQLHAEVPQEEPGIESPILGRARDQGDRVSQEGGLGNAPPALAAAQLEDAFACSSEDAIGHGHPPERACMT